VRLSIYLNSSILDITASKSADDIFLKELLKFFKHHRTHRISE